jgi:transposase
VRLPVAKGQPDLWVRLARPLPYPPEQVRAVTLLADGGRLWLAVTAAIPVQHHDLDPGRVAGVDLGIIHPYAVVSDDAGLLVSGRAIRAESYLHLRDQQTRHARTAQRAPKRAADPRALGCRRLSSTVGAGVLPARRDRRRHLHDWRRRRSCLASGHPDELSNSLGCRSPRVPDLAPGEDQAALPNRADVA